MDNIIYVLINEAMPGYVKIGKTNNLEQRIRSLDNTSVPLPFECFYATPKKDFVETEEDQQALNQARVNRAVFNFSMVNIPLGAELVWYRNENIKAKVVDNRLIEFNGETTSLSNSAQKLLGYNYKVAGTLYWMYEGETLDERRRRFESGE